MTRTNKPADSTASFRVSSAEVHPEPVAAPSPKGKKLADAPPVVLKDEVAPPEEAIGRSEAPAARYRVEESCRIYYCAQLVILTKGQVLNVQHFGPEKIAAFQKSGAKLAPLVE